VYDAQFPHGSLGEDAGLLRIRALLAAGRRPEATAFATSFEQRFPESSYLAPIRALLAKNP
jgi:hypothetical protein